MPKKKMILFLAAAVLALGTAGFVFAKAEKANSANPAVNANSQKNASPAANSASGTNAIQSQSPSETQNQEKNKNANQGESSQEQNQNQEQNNVQAGDMANFGQANADSHRSAVAKFVKNLLEVAKNEDNGEANGIGAQVRNVAMQQNQGETQTITAMEQVQTRSKIKTFLVGSDYKNLGALRSEMVETRNRIRQLTELMNKTVSEETKQQLQEQIRLFEQEQAKIEQFIAENEKKVSLFGWLAKMFQ